MQPERCAPTTDSHVRTARYATTRRGRASARPLLRIRLGANAPPNRTNAHPLLSATAPRTDALRCLAQLHLAPSSAHAVKEGSEVAVQRMPALG